MRSSAICCRCWRKSGENNPPVSASGDAESSVEKPGDATDGVGRHRIAIRKVEAMALAGVGDEFSLRANLLAEFSQPLSLGEGNVPVGFAVQFDQRWQMIDAWSHRGRHAAIQHGQRT